jgi:hypothetical protein
MLLKVRIPGKKGVDYWPLRVKTKGYIANIPLNHKTAKFMNSCEYGFLDVNYCIGWDMSPAYWHKHVIQQQKVPIYLINGVGKWVIMILPDNETYEVWDKMNNEDKARKNIEPIKGLSIKKNFISPKLAKLYDEIRIEFYEGEDNKNNLLARFAPNRNSIEIDDIRTANDFDEVMDEKWFHDCNISISETFVNIDGGKVNGAILHDTVFGISLMEVDITLSTVDIGEYDSSVIRKCNIDNYCIIKNTDIIESKVNKSTVYRCNIDDSELSTTSITDCSIAGGKVDNISIRESEISDTEISGSTKAKDTSMHDIIIKDGGYFESCNFYASSLFKGIYRNCNFHDETYVDDSCEIL